MEKIKIKIDQDLLLLAGVLSIFVLVLFLKIDYWKGGMGHDQYRYLLVAKALVNKGRFSLFGVPFYQHPPLVMHLMAGVFSLFGIHELVARIFVIACTLVFFVGIYLVSKKFVKEPGLYVGLLAFNSIIFNFSKTPMLENFLIGFSGLSMLAFLRGLEKDNKKMIYLSGIFTGLGLLTKDLAMLILPNLVVTGMYYFFVSKKLDPIKYTLIAIIIALIIASPWYYYKFVNKIPINPFEAHKIEAVAEESFTMPEPWHFYFSHITNFAPVYIILLALIGIMHPAAIWVILPMILMSYPIGKGTRYLVGIIPGIYLLAVNGLLKIESLIEKAKHKHILIIGGLLVLAQVVGVWTRYTEIKKPYYEYQVVDYVKNLPKDSRILVADEAGVFAFNTNYFVEWVNENLWNGTVVAKDADYIIATEPIQGKGIKLIKEFDKQPWKYIYRVDPVEVGKGFNMVPVNVEIIDENGRIEGMIITRYNLRQWCPSGYCTIYLKQDEEVLVFAWGHQYKKAKISLGKENTVFLTKELNAWKNGIPWDRF